MIWPMHTIAVSRTVHVADTCIRDMHTANNACERFNGEIRDRIARIRGLKSKDPAMLGLMIVYHNFMRPYGARMAGLQQMQAEDMSHRLGVCKQSRLQVCTRRIRHDHKC